jgi:hypothetical protein
VFVERQALAVKHPGAALLACLKRAVDDPDVEAELHL